MAVIRISEQRTMHLYNRRSSSTITVTHSYLQEKFLPVLVSYLILFVIMKLVSDCETIVERLLTGASGIKQEYRGYKSLNMIGAWNFVVMILIVSSSYWIMYLVNKKKTVKPALKQHSSVFQKTFLNKVVSSIKYINPVLIVSKKSILYRK